jgi:hypothetical protein
VGVVNGQPGRFLCKGRGKSEAPEGCCPWPSRPVDPDGCKTVADLLSMHGSADVLLLTPRPAGRPTQDGHSQNDPAKRKHSRKIILLRGNDTTMSSRGKLLSAHPRRSCTATAADGAASIQVRAAGEVGSVAHRRFCFCTACCHGFSH